MKKIISAAVIMMTVFALPAGEYKVQEKESTESTVKFCNEIGQKGYEVKGIIKEGDIYQVFYEENTDVQSVIYENNMYCLSKRGQNINVYEAKDGCYLNARFETSGEDRVINCRSIIVQEDKYIVNSVDNTTMFLDKKVYHKFSFQSLEF